MRFVFAALLCSAVQLTAQPVHMELLGSYQTRVYNEGAAEIADFDPGTRRLFIVNGAAKTVDAISIADPAKPVLAFQIHPLAGCGSSANSVAVKNGMVAVAFQAEPKTDPGFVQFQDAYGNNRRCVQVGALPDMLTFTPDGTKVLVANEGEPNDAYTIDPEGTVSIIDVSGGMESISQFNVTTVGVNGLRPDGTSRIFGPKASVAQDLEPEYITVSPDSKTAYVTFQEANAIGILDIDAAKFRALKGLGLKDHSLPGNGLDASDRDNGIRIAPRPVWGAYQPDAIVAFQADGLTYLMTANEGDTRAYTAYSEEVRAGAAGYRLDAGKFPNAAALKQNENLGRLTVTNATGDTDRDGDFDRIVVPGARSFSVWNTDLNQVFDSGDQLEQITAKTFPRNFNASNTDNDFDSRSDNKGPEPEGATVGTIRGTTYGFVGLERIGGVMVYSLNVPTKPEFVHYSNNRNFAVATDAGTQAGTVGDLGPEGVLFINAANSPIKEPLLVTANEISGSTSIFQLQQLTDLAGKVTVAVDKVEYIAASKRSRVTLKLENISGEVLRGPFFASFADLPATTQPARMGGMLAHGHYTKLDGPTVVEAGVSVAIVVEFDNPNDAALQVKAKVYAVRR